MNQFKIDFIKSRFEYLNLSDEQANKVLEYEKLTYLNSDKYIFSDWEEFDFEEMNFRSFLSDEQLTRYRDLLQIRKQECESEIRRLDANYEGKIVWAQQKLTSLKTFVKEQILTDIRFEILTNSVCKKHKLDYLKAEYKNFINNQKKRSMVDFARHCKGLSPFEWQVSLLHQNMNYVFPDYYLFKKTMDTVTLEIALTIENRLSLHMNNSQQFLQQKMEVLKIINDEFREKMAEAIDFNDPATVLILKKPSQIECYMSFLLIDKTFYEL